MSSIVDEILKARRAENPSLTIDECRVLGDDRPGRIRSTCLEGIKFAIPADVGVIVGPTRVMTPDPGNPRRLKMSFSIRLAGTIIPGLYDSVPK